MSEKAEWEFPEAARARPDSVGFDLDRALSSVVSLRAEIPEESFTAGILGTERAGNGIVIDESGLVLTIGYLIAEAESVWLSGHTGTAARAHVVAYDFETGFGLVQALDTLDLPALQFGSVSRLPVGSEVIVAGHGGRRHALLGSLVGKREFAGYWEYVIDDALFTTPAHPNWGGTALLGPDGSLCGVGSLFVQNARGGEQHVEGNMSVPIDLLPPILDDLLAKGQVGGTPRPWLGIYAAETQEKIVVVGVVENGPAFNGGLRPGDVVLDIAGAPVGGLPDFFRTIWEVGPAGAIVPLNVWREGELRELRIESSDRNAMMRFPRLH